MRTRPQLTRPLPVLPVVLSTLFALGLAACGDKDTGGTATPGTDADGDGFDVEVDCDDSDDTVFPGAPELCNERDDDCDEDVDEDPAEGPLWYADADGDGFGSETYTVIACTQPEGWVDLATDCDDLSADSYPNAPETCDDRDNDCDGNIDESVDDAPVWYVDADGDGYGDPDAGVSACDAPDLYVQDDQDCNDDDAAINPTTVWYGDVDEDGYGGELFTFVGCQQPDGHTDVTGDCDDLDDEVNPDAEEVCDGLDNDCDGSTDAEASDGSTFYEDNDGDGFGIDDGETTLACDAPDGFAAEIGDCNDDDDTVNPGQLEACGDGIDNNCDDVIDAQCAASLAAADVTVDGAGSSNYSGYRVSTAGDLNGDGQTDLAIGAYGANDLSGAAYVVLGPFSSGDALLLDDADLSIDNITEDDYFGSSVRLSGDATGDGTDDLTVGAWGRDTDIVSVGASFVFTGPITGALELDSADFIVNGVDSLDYLGHYLGITGPDLTGDGQGDFIAGASGDDDAGTAGGAVNIFAGPVAGTIDGDSADVRIVAESSAAYLGYNAAFGDVDGDGQDDLFIGASGDAKAYLLYGPLTEDVDAADADVILTASTTDGTGSNTALGDFDGDGSLELAVGRKYVTYEETGNAGAWSVMDGPLTADMSIDDAIFTVTEISSNEYYGAQYIQVAVGDIDDDGADDLLTGAPTNDIVGSTAGAAFLYLGPLSGTATISDADMTLYGEEGGNAAGYGVDLGDLDGDGTLDITIGARGYDSGAGRTYVVFGGGF